MALTYEKAPAAIQAMVEKTIEAYHPDLKAVHLTVNTIIVCRYDKIPGGEDGDTEQVHALKKSGYPIDAKIGVTSPADRARGIADCKLMIDGLEWNKATDRQRAALIDHELEHLNTIELKPTKKDPARCGPKYDDLGRPCLRIRPHDWELAGFKDVAERHGNHSHEAMQFQHFRMEYAQLNLFGNEVLAIAEGKNGNPIKTVEDALRKVLKPGKGIDKVTITTGNVSVSSDDIKEFRKVPASAKSKACRNRHHKECRMDGCKCDCGHSGAAATA